MRDPRPGVYEIDAEDSVQRCSCPCCKRCWVFTWCKSDRYGRRGKLGVCVFGGPFEGFDKSERDRA